MVDYPDIHSYKSIEEYWKLSEKLWDIKDKEERKQIYLDMIKLVPNVLIEGKEYDKKEVEARKEWHKKCFFASYGRETGCLAGY